MLALGLCLGVMIVSADGSDQTSRDGRLVSLRDLSVEFSSSSGGDAVRRTSESRERLDFVSALNLISRFIGAADSVSSDEVVCEGPLPIDRIDSYSLDASTQREFGIGINTRQALSSTMSITNYARASL